MNNRQKTNQPSASRQPRLRTAVPGDSLETQAGGYQESRAMLAILNIELPASRSYRRATVLRLQSQVGNARVQRFLASAAPKLPPVFIQRKGGKKGKGNSGTGPGAVKGAKEAYYDVSGKTLDDITGQLKKYGGFAAETYIGLGIKDNKVTPEKTKGGSLKATVQWVTADEETRLPRWVDYNKACPPAKKEWDRFMTQTRIHEQQAHIDASQKFLKSLGKKDTVNTGPIAEDFKANLEAKQQELGKRLQAIHDACDHGTSIDAILHPDKGKCDSEEKTE